MPKQVRKALIAQSRQLGAKPHWNGSRLYNFLSHSLVSYHYSPHPAAGHRSRAKGGAQSAYRAKSPTRRKGSQTRRSSARHGTTRLQPIPPPPPKQVSAGQEQHGVPGFMALTHTLLPSSKTRRVVCGSAEVVLRPERAKLLVPTAALATPYKRAKPKQGQKQGYARRC